LKDETKKNCSFYYCGRKIPFSVSSEENESRPGNGNQEKPQKKKHLISFPPLINIIINQAATFKAPNLWRESKICSKLTFFGPKVEPSSLPPHPKTATPV